MGMLPQVQERIEWVASEEAKRKKREKEGEAIRQPEEIEERRGDGRTNEHNEEPVGREKRRRTDIDKYQKQGENGQGQPMNTPADATMSTVQEGAHQGAPIAESPQCF